MARRLNTRSDIWDRIDARDLGECWPYTGAVSSKGYGIFHAGGRAYRAHRVTYELTKGPIPDGLQLDHLCRNRRCCNPGHLEAVTCKENLARSPIHNSGKTHCPQGHEYTPNNTYFYAYGRQCRICKKAQGQKRRGKTIS